MQLPKKIKVGRKWYAVEMHHSGLDKSLMGRVHYPERKIHLGLRSKRHGYKYAKAEIYDTFWHELVHAILEDMGQDSLNRNERFVTGFANRLTKAIMSAKFE